ncbi:hypothetical protein [Rouxiella sp. WC2420]|uniref:Uncharacterized protein n=1 Tax=Rouxiella sp. WC2420 TaxID=3234145 RepID=A0AB39VTW1_9GAMM
MTAIDALASPLQKLYYNAQNTLALSDLDEEKISQIARDLDSASSDEEHYVTGWMALNSVVLIRRYQNNRGSADGLVFTRANKYRLSVQSVMFRIPKPLLWVTFRRRPRTMKVITYNRLGSQQDSLQQFDNIQEEELKQQLEADWRELNDYLGLACWQRENGQPLWNALQKNVSPERILKLCQSHFFTHSRLQKEGDFEGLWHRGLFIARRGDGAAALQLSWQNTQTQEVASYLFEIFKKDTGPTRLRLSLRPGKQEKFYPLNPFDAQHLYDAMQMFERAEGALGVLEQKSYHQR